MKKRILLFLCILLAAALSMQGCLSSLLSVQTERRGPAMWIIEDNDGHRCYLFGTFYAGKDDSMFPLSDVIEDAYSYCSAVAVEYDMTADVADAAPVYDDGTTIKDHLSENVYNAAVSLIKIRDGEYKGQYDDYTIAAWYSILDQYVTSSSGYSTEYGTDVYFVKKAKADNKKLYELEGAEYLDGIGAYISDRVYEAFIISLLNSRGGSSLSSYDTIYKNGDMTTLTYAVNSSRSAQYQDAALSADMETYYTKMFTERNIKIADGIKEYLASGERVFVAVDCSHIVGNDGIAAVLQSGGYKVIRK